MRLFFSGEQEFAHYGSRFVFKPEEGITSFQYRPALFGWIAREKRVFERTPPSEGLEPTEHLSWQAIFVAIDPTEHADGQAISIESNEEIGRPKAIIRSLIKAMNDRFESPYFAQVFPLVSEGSFWEFAHNHGDRIKSITFDVAAPNVFNDAEDFQNEMRSLRDGENVANVRTTLESDGTLNHRTPRMDGLVTYVERGAGELLAEAVDGAKYSSSSFERRVSVPIEKPNAATVRRFLRDIATMIDRIFP